MAKTEVQVKALQDEIEFIADKRLKKDLYAIYLQMGSDLIRGYDFLLIDDVDKMDIRKGKTLQSLFFVGMRYNSNQEEVHTVSGEVAVKIYNEKLPEYMGKALADLLDDVDRYKKAKELEELKTKK